MAPATGNNDGQNTVFIDTSLDTHLATIVSDSDTVSHLKRKIMLEHRQCFPAIGDIKIDSLKVKRRGNFYHLSDSMLVKSAIATTKNNWFISVDVSRVEQDSVIQNFDKLKAGGQLALPWVTDNRSIDQGSPSTHPKIVPVVNHVVSSVSQFTFGDSVEDLIKITEEDRPLNTKVKSKKRPHAVQNESLLEDASGSKPSVKKNRKTQKKEANVKASEDLGDKSIIINNEKSVENELKVKDLNSEVTRINKGENCSVLDQVAAVVTSIVEDIRVETCHSKSTEASETVPDIEMVAERDTQQEKPSETSQNEKDDDLVQNIVTGNEIPSSSIRTSDGEREASALGHGKGEKPSTIKAAEKQVPSASLIKEPDNINKDAIDPSKQEVGSTVQESAGDQIDNHKEDKQSSLKQRPEVNVPEKKKKVKKSAVKKKDISLVKHDNNPVSDISLKVPAPVFSEKITDENDKVSLSNAEKNGVSEKTIMNDVIAKEVEISQPTQSNRSLVHVENMEEKSRNEFIDTVGSRKKKKNVGRSTLRNDDSVVKHTNDAATLANSERKETADIQIDNEAVFSRIEKNPSQVNAESIVEISEKQNDKMDGTKKKKKTRKTKKSTGGNEDEPKTKHANNGDGDKSTAVSVPALNDHLHENAKENETKLADADGKDGDETKGKDAQAFDEGLSIKAKKNHKSTGTVSQDLPSKWQSTELELEPEKSQTINHHHLPEESSKNLTTSEVSNKMNEKGAVNIEADTRKDGSSEINFINNFAPEKDTTQSVKEKKSKKKTKEPPLVDSRNDTAIQSQKIISKNENKIVPTDVAKDPNIPNTDRFKTPKKIRKIDAPQTSKSAHAKKGHGEPSAESFLNQKSGKQQLTLGEASVKTVKKSALVVNSSQNVKSLLNRPKAIFGGDSDKSSADDNATVNLDSSTHTPSGKSSSSGDSATSIDSRRNGSRPTKRKEGGGEDGINSQRKSMADLLRSSSRFKKAKVTASQRGWDTESKPVDFVSESQPVA